MGLARRTCARAPIAGAAVVLLIACLAPVVQAVPNNTATWSVQATANHPGSPENLLYGVSCPTAKRCEAVGLWAGSGEVFHLLAEGWNGSRWLLQAPPKPPGTTFSLLYGVSCSSGAACTAVGEDSNGMLGEAWNGQTWSFQPATDPSQANATVLQSVSCTAATSCTAVGMYSKIPKGGGTAVDYPLAERWNGTHWAIEPTPNPVGSTGTVLRGVSCLSATWCLAVGSYQRKSGYVHALSELWNGSRWSIEAVPDPAESTNTVLDGVDCLGVNACTASGLGPNGYTLVETWNGKWSIQASPSPDPGTDFLPSVSCPSVLICMAAGDSQPTSISGSTFAERRSGPTTWTVQSTPTPSGTGLALFQGISCSGPNTCTAVGYYAGPGGLSTLSERYSG
jgi:hypothetical protein